MADLADSDRRLVILADADPGPHGQFYFDVVETLASIEGSVLWFSERGHLLTATEFAQLRADAK